MNKSIPLLYFASALSCATANAWTHVSTYTLATGSKATYVIAAPSAPPEINKKLPVIIYEQGDSTTDIILKTAPFEPSVFAKQMEQASLGSGFVWAIPEVRTQTLGADSLGICNLDFSHRALDLNAFIDQIKLLPFVDGTRIFLVGHSAGADTVTHVGKIRADIRGIINLAGGVSSCSEAAVDCPANLQSDLQYQCSPEQSSRRSSQWWRELFLESNLFASISSLHTPYLALIGQNDQVISVSNFVDFSARIARSRAGFESIVLPGLDHVGVVTDPRAFGLLIKFIKENL